jgi:hypothetical protein
MDIMCGDGTTVSIPYISEVKESIDVYIEESRHYRTLIEIKKEVEGSDNLWDWKYQLVNKEIQKIHVYASVIGEGGVVEENLMYKWEHTKHFFHGVYRTISYVADRPVNMIHLILSANIPH